MYSAVLFSLEYITSTTVFNISNKYSSDFTESVVLLWTGTKGREVDGGKDIFCPYF